MKNILVSNIFVRYILYITKILAGKIFVRPFLQDSYKKFLSKIFLTKIL
jgi:hypothetical protein